MDEKPYIKVWVGNVGKYNEGKLKGEWLELPVTSKELHKFLRNEVGLQLSQREVNGALEKTGTAYEEYMINDIDTNLEFLFPIDEYTSLEQLNTLAYLLGKTEDIEAVKSYLESYELEDLTEIMNVIIQENKIEFYRYEFEGIDENAYMSPEEKYGYTLLTQLGYLEKLEEMNLDWCIDVEKYRSSG